MVALFQNERFGFSLLVAGMALVIVGTIWLIARAFHTSFGWGLAALIPVLGPLAFLIARFPRAKSPATIILLGAVLGFLPIVLNTALGEKSGVEPRTKSLPTS